MALVDNNILSSVTKIDRLELLPSVFETVETLPSVLGELDRAEVDGYTFVSRLDGVKSYNYSWLKIVTLTGAELELPDDRLVILRRCRDRIQYVGGEADAAHGSYFVAAVRSIAAGGSTQVRTNLRERRPRRNEIGSANRRTGPASPQRTGRVWGTSRANTLVAATERAATGFTGYSGLPRSSAPTQNFRT